MPTAAKQPTIQEGAEKVVDGIEDIVEVAPQAAAQMNRVVLLTGGIAIGVSVGFLVAKKILEKKIRKEAEAEIQQIREIYLEKAQKLERDSGATRVMDEKETVQEIMAKKGYNAPTAEDQRYTEAEQRAIMEANEAAARAERAAERAEEIAETEVVVTNVFTPGEGIDDWDWDIERELREEGRQEVPYVIHRDEYFQHESGFEQQTLTYFEGDDVLADSHDTPVDDQDAYVGLGNLAKFGHGSGDPNVVYVRNHELELEFEIVHSDGKFSEERRDPTIEAPDRDEKGRFKPQNDQSPDQGDPRRRRSRGS